MNMNSKSFLQSILLGLAVIIAALSVWYGLAVIARVGLKFTRTTTSPSLFTAFYFGVLFSLVSLFFTARCCSGVQKFFSFSLASSVIAVSVVYSLLYLFGFIQTWPLLDWLRNGLEKTAIIMYLEHRTFSLTRILRL
jgi:hypothetical protein